MPRKKYPIITRKKKEFTVRWAGSEDTASRREEVMGYPVKLAHWLDAFVFKHDGWWYCCDCRTGLAKAVMGTMSNTVWAARQAVLRVGCGLYMAKNQWDEEWHDNHDRSLEAKVDKAFFAAFEDGHYDNDKKDDKL